MVKLRQGEKTVLRCPEVRLPQRRNVKLIKAGAEGGHSVPLRGTLHSGYREDLGGTRNTGPPQGGNIGLSGKGVAA